VRFNLLWSVGVCHATPHDLRHAGDVIGREVRAVLEETATVSGMSAPRVQVQAPGDERCVFKSSKVHGGRRNFALASQRLQDESERAAWARVRY
jgi:hypothetical protein